MRLIINEFSLSLQTSIVSRFGLKLKKDTSLCFQSLLRSTARVSFVFLSRSFVPGVYGLCQCQKGVNNLNVLPTQQILRWPILLISFHLDMFRYISGLCVVCIKHLEASRILLKHRSRILYSILHRVFSKAKSTFFQLLMSIFLALTDYLYVAYYFNTRYWKGSLMAFLWTGGL